MKFVSAATAVFVSSFVTKQTSAFSPVFRRTVGVAGVAGGVDICSTQHNQRRQQQQQRRAFVSATRSAALHMANVVKLTEPQTQLLNEVDVFIFDCDGVIWRVRTCQYYC